MTRIGAVRQSWRWLWLFGALTIVTFLMLSARAYAGETGSTDEYGGVALTNSVLLDPFDPVPSIHFHDGGCDGGGCVRHCDRDDCGQPLRCDHDCRWHGWFCPHDCYDMHRPRPGAYNLGWWRCANECRDGDWWCDHDCTLEGWHCEHDCFVHQPERRDRRPTQQLGDICPDICYGRLVHDYEEQLKHHAEEQRHYEEQQRWYFQHVIDDHRGFFGRLFDFGHHDSPPPPPPPPPLPPPPNSYGAPTNAYGPPPPNTHGPGPSSAYGPGPGDYGQGGYGPPRPGGNYGPPPGNYGGSASTPPPSNYNASTTPSSSSSSSGTPATPPPGAISTTPSGPGPGASDFGTPKK